MTRDRAAELAMEAASALADAGAALEAGDMQALAEALSTAQQRWEELSPPIPISVASRQLDVSPPTVRKWLQRGLLERAPGTTLAVTAESLAALKKDVNRFRAAGRNPELRALLRARLEDRDLLGQPRIQRAVKLMREQSGRRYVQRPDPLRRSG